MCDCLICIRWLCCTLWVIICGLGQCYNCTLRMDCGWPIEGNGARTLAAVGKLKGM